MKLYETQFISLFLILYLHCSKYTCGQTFLSTLNTELTLIHAIQTCPILSFGNSFPSNKL